MGYLATAGSSENPDNGQARGSQGGAIHRLLMIFYYYYFSIIACCHYLHIHYHHYHTHGRGVHSTLFHHSLWSPQAVMEQLIVKKYLNLQLIIDK